MRAGERGQLVIIVAVGMVAFLGFAALVLDLGYAYSQRRLAQNGADAATMAAVRMVRLGAPNTPGSVVYNEIVRVAALNGNSQIDGATTEFLDVSGASLGPVATYSGSMENVAGVRVKTRIQFNTFFAGVVGVNTLTAGGSAAAMSMGIASVSNPGGGGLRPIGVPDQNYQPGTVYTIWDDDREAPGNAGWLDMNGGSNSEAELGDWLLNGFNPSPSNPFLYYEGGSSPGTEHQGTSLPFPSWVQGDPGIRSSNKDELEAQIGDHITILIYDNLTGEGANSRYRVIGLAEFVVTSVDLTGNPKTVKGEFVDRVVGGGVTPASYYTTGMMSTVRLIPPSVPTSGPSPTAVPAPTATTPPGPTSTPPPPPTNTFTPVPGPTSTSTTGPTPTNTVAPTSTYTPTTGPTSTPTATTAAPTATSTTAPTATPTPTPAPPAAPSNLTMGTITRHGNDCDIPLSWQDNSGDESGFYVERSPNGTSGWTRVQTTGPNVTSWTDVDLPRDTTYYYRVQSFNATGASAYSNVVSGTTP